MPKMLKRVFAAIGIALLLLVVVVAGYVAYLMLTYYRIPDNATLEVENNPTAVLKQDTPYTAATYNVGFGAYTPDYTFFMDEGAMDDGTKTVGKRSVAESEESVRACTDGAIKAVQDLDPDFVLLQEVDTDSMRSYHVNQKQAFEQAFPAFGSSFAQNFHSSYLAYPVLEHHGVVNSGLLTLSDTHVDSATRRSYPVDDAFPTKFFDLDRCFEVERLPVENGKELVLINSHMSVFDEGGLIRAQQLDLLTGLLADERAKGNYVIAGGDWNHALCGSEGLYKSEQLVPPWVFPFDDAVLPEGFSVVRATNLEDVPTCRGVDIPYEKDRTYTVTVDGFIVSDNVKATVENIDTGFANSDHNPVKLTFELT